MPEDTATEEHRHRCEVRQILRWRIERGREFAHAYIEGVEEHYTDRAGVRRTTVKQRGIRHVRGQAAAERLLADCRDQFAKGNTGEHGVWLS